MEVSQYMPQLEYEYYLYDYLYGDLILYRINRRTKVIQSSTNRSNFKIWSGGFNGTVKLLNIDCVKLNEIDLILYGIIE